MTPQKVRYFRREWSLSQRELAELVGTRSARTVRRWEHGERDVPDSAKIIMSLINQDERLIDEIFQIRGELKIPPITDANEDLGDGYEEP